MYDKLDIIPTPYHIEYTPGSIFRIKTISSEISATGILKSALDLVYKKCNIDPQHGREIFLTLEKKELKDEVFISNPLTHEQGYAITTEADGKIVICSETEIGLAYGLMTIIQLEGKELSSINILDVPDFRHRGNKWTVWAELGMWSYDYGDGIDNFKKRIVRKLDNCLLYKINTVYFDAFGLRLDRFSEYADIMRFSNDKARERGINLITGCYGMGYGMSGHLNSYQGRSYKNRLSYPDGDIYPCIGNYNAKKASQYLTIEERIGTVFAREHGTCLSNMTLNEIKIKEFEDYIRSTHCGGLYMHNMDADEMHPEIWLTRCKACRKKWPSDDIFAPDGAAGAFADYLNLIMDRINEIEEDGYCAKRDFFLTVVSPGYLYAVNTNGKTFDIGIKFWAEVSKLLKHSNIAIGFREQFFYHDKDVIRGTELSKNSFASESCVINFSGADGFYDDKLFTPTAIFNYMMRDYGSMIMANGNAFQEVLQVFNSEYLWRRENSAFYNLAQRPDNQDDYMELYKSAIASRFRPDEIYGEGGLIDVIADKLYGSNAGRYMAELNKICGNNGEPPIPCACSVDIYTNYTKIVYPMRWDNPEIAPAKIDEMCQRFCECSKASKKAYSLTQMALKALNEDIDLKDDISWLSECFYMGSTLCSLLYRYMLIYKELDASFINGESKEPYAVQINSLLSEAKKFTDYVSQGSLKAFDKLGGSLARREEMADFIEYNLSLMKQSIEGGMRIPDDRRPDRTRDWW